jgi:putative ABC transport system permease protein
MIDTLVQDAKYALRSLARSPGFTLVAVLTLAIGIGANSAVFSGVYSLLFNPLPFIDGSRAVAVWEVMPQGNNDHNEVSPANFWDFRAAATGSFDNLVAHQWWPANLTGGLEPERVQGFRVSPDFFQALGIEPLLGRTFAPGEDQVVPPRVVVLSYGLWQRRFGGDRAIIGRAIPVNGIDRTVIGVLPRAVAYPAPGDLWAPLAMDSTGWENRRAHYLLVTGRLKPGATAAGAQAELALIAARLGTTYPESNAGRSVNVQPLERDVARMLQPILLTLFAAVAFVLLIACVNVANLLLARGTRRRRELALRAALGAQRQRLVRQLLTESAVLAVAGAALGVLVAAWGANLLTGLVPQEHQRFLAGFDRIGINGPVLAFTALAALATTLVFGLLPAVRSARGEVHEALQEGERSGGSPTRHRLRRALVAAEVALALVLLVAAGLMFRSMQHLLATSPGFDPDGVALTTVVLPGQRYDADGRAEGFYRDLLERLNALPGVRAAGAASVTPLCQCNQTTSFQIVGQEPFRRGAEPDVGFRVVSPAYFAALDVPIVTGRGFAATDDARAPAVVVVNQTLERRWFPQGAVGRRMRVAGDTAGALIVGVVADFRHAGPAQPPGPELYLPMGLLPRLEMTIAVRGADPVALLPQIRAAVRAIDGDQPVSDQRTMRAALNATVGPQRLSQRLLGALGIIALVLAGVGIYAVIAQLVAERTREIGIRVALGSDRGAVLALVLRQGLTPAAWGVGIGAVAAFGTSQLLRRQLFGVQPGDPLTIVVVSVALFLVAALASYAPAYRATRVDPMVALRTE